jgi:hypothetical protein
MQAKRHSTTLGGTVLALLAAAVLALSGATTSSAKPVAGGPPDTYVANWDAVGTQAFSAAGLTPAEGHVIFAYVAIAIYDSVMAVKGGHEPFAVDVDAPDNTSAEAAVAAAARRILEHYLPAQTALVEGAYASSLSSIADGPAKTNGITLGTAVADLLIVQRSDDGFRANVGYAPPSPADPGDWVPTAATPPIGSYLGHMRPFSLKSADQFRPGPPPGLGTKKWADEFNEVKTIGSNSASSPRTPEQTVAARFWAEAPVQQARGSFRKFVLDHQLDVADAARFLAMMSVTYADGLIACFDAKYTYERWRPITAIRAGDTDGNSATVGDPTWTPLLPATPNHPEYPSAHSCITPASGVVISRFLRNPVIDFTIPSLTGLGDRHFARPADLTYDVGNARIWGGIHFRSAIDEGVKISTRTADYVLAHDFHTSNG